MIHPGIKQGCPASGSIFTLCLDPFVRYLCYRLPRPLASFYAFADDLAALVRDFFEQMPSIKKCFAILKLAAALGFHPKKTQVVPFGPRGAQEVQAWVSSLITSWNRMQVGGHLLYLGVQLGPQADEHQWEATTSKFQVAAHSLELMKLAWPMAALWHQVAVQSILSYVASLSEPSTTI